MGLLNKLTIKNLKLNKKRTIVTIIGIMLSVALITAVASMYSSAIQSLINYETREKGNFHVAFFDVPVSEITTFKNNRKIESINLTQSIGYSKIDSQNEYKPYAYIKSFTSDSLKNLSIKLVEGRLPQNENEIIIPTHLKSNGRIFLNVGDTISLDIGKRVDSTGYELNQFNPFQKNEENNSSEQIIDTQKKEYKIVGIIERPATNIEQRSAPGYTFITYLDSNNLSGNVDLYTRYTKDGMKNVYEVTANILGVDAEKYERYLNPTGEEPDEDIIKFGAEVENKYKTNINQYLIDLETDPIGSSSVGGLGIVVGIVVGIIVFTSVFCIKNSFDISITEKTKQYGMLRSIGATKKQIKRNVFYEATVLGIIGIPLGIILGFLASYILIIISNYFLGNNFVTGLVLEFEFSYIAVIVAVLLGIITIYFSAFRSARRASKISPIESIRNSGNIKIKSKKLKSPKLIKKLFGIGGEISYKNLKRNKKKYRTTVISIVVSVFVFVALSSFMSMAFDTVENELQISDYNVSLSSTSIYDASEEKYNKFIDTTKLDNIEDYTILRNVVFEYKNRRFNPEYIKWGDLDLDEKVENEATEYFNIYTLGKEQYNKYIKTLGLNYDEIKDKAILMDYSKVPRYVEGKNKPEFKTMRIYDYQKGEKLEGRLIDDKPYTIEIGYVTDVVPFGLKDHADGYLIISEELYNKIAPDKMSKVIKIMYKSNNADKLQNDIDELLKGENYNLNNKEENVRAMNNLFTLVGIFLYGFIIVISLIGITNIFNTITTNMELRKQEFAMLKSIGMTNSEFKRMIRLESTFMGVKSLLFGLPIGIGLSYLIYHFLTEQSGLPYKLPVVGIIIAIVAVFILISSLMRYSMNKINKQNTIETIRNENI